MAVSPRSIFGPLDAQGPVVIGIPVDYRDNHRLMDIVHAETLN